MTRPARRQLGMASKWSRPCPCSMSAAASRSSGWRGYAGASVRRGIPAAHDSRCGETLPPRWCSSARDSMSRARRAVGCGVRRSSVEATSMCSGGGARASSALAMEIAPEARGGGRRDGSGAVGAPAVARGALPWASRSVPYGSPFLTFMPVPYGSPFLTRSHSDAQGVTPPPLPAMPSLPLQVPPPLPRTHLPYA